MSNGIVIPIDGDTSKIDAKLRKVKKDSASAGKSFGQAGSQAARFGGAGGGAMGRALGGFAQGGAAGMVGLGLTGAGLALNAFLQRDAERVNMAKAREVRSQDRDAQARTVMERRSQLSAGGIGFLGSARRMISSGADPGLMRSRIEMGAKYGLSAKETISAWEQSGDGVSTGNIAVGLSTGMIGDTPEAVAGNIRKFNGVQNAIAAMRNVTQSEAGDIMSRAESDPRSGNLARAGSAMSPVEQAQLDSLMGGDTARVLEGQAKDMLNPGAKLAAEAGRKAMETVAQLQAAAASQSTVAALLAEMGRVIGMSEGSASRQLTVGAQAAAE